MRKCHLLMKQHIKDFAVGDGEKLKEAVVAIMFIQETISSGG